MYGDKKHTKDVCSGRILVALEEEFVLHHNMEVNIAEQEDLLKFGFKIILKSRIQNFS